MKFVNAEGRKRAMANTWNAMYPDRRQFEDLEKSTQNDWFVFIGLAQDFLISEAEENESHNTFDP